MRRYLFWVTFLVLVTARILTSHSDYTEGDRIRITTRVTSEPVRYEYSQGVRIDGLWMFLPLFPEIRYGDIVVVEGVVSDGLLDNASLLRVEKNRGLLYQTRQNIIKVYQRSLPSPHNSLVAGMTLGSKKLLPRDFWESLKSTGTAHVVVASGMNITLVGNFLIGVLVLFISRKRAVIFSLMGIWIYAILAGFDAPIIRAAIMGSVGFGAMALGRINVAWRALFFSAGVMLLVTPEWITDLGFILSFFATASLMLFERSIRRLLVRIKVPRIVREDLSTSLAAQIGVAPVLYFSFGSINIFSPIINMLIIWTVIPITIIGVIGGVLGLMMPVVGQLVLLLTYPLTWWFVEVVKYAG